MEVLPTTEREDAYRSLVEIQDMFDIEETMQNYIETFYGKEGVEDEDAKTVAAGFAVDKARESGSLYRFLTVKLLLDKNPEFGSIDESEEAYLQLFRHTMSLIKKGFLYNIAKETDPYFYNDELKKILF